MSLLAATLFREVRPDFFRVLSGPLARLYVDALDMLEREASERNQGLDREEALGVLEQVVEQHADLASAGEELVSKAVTPREKARAVLETLRVAGWLQEEERSDWHRLIFFEPSGTMLLQALRKIASPDAAAFSDKLVTVCITGPWRRAEHRGTPRRSLGTDRNIHRQLAGRPRRVARDAEIH